MLYNSLSDTLIVSGRVTKTIINQQLQYANSLDQLTARTNKHNKQRSGSHRNSTEADADLAAVLLTIKNTTINHQRSGLLTCMLLSNHLYLSVNSSSHLQEQLIFKSTQQHRGTRKRQHRIVHNNDVCNCSMLSQSFVGSGNQSLNLHLL